VRTREDGDFTVGGACGKDLVKVPFWLLKFGFIALFGKVFRRR
jgi:hypothetical protein